MDQRLRPRPDGREAEPEHVLPPDPVPLAMPDQILWPTRRRWPRLPPDVVLARLLLVACCLVGTAAFGWTLYRVLSVQQPTPLQLVFLGLSTLCFAWVSIGSSTALVGFVWLCAGRAANPLTAATADVSRPALKTALLCPVYREDPASIAAHIETMSTALEKAGLSGSFDIFVLSDTQDLDERQREHDAIEFVREQSRAPVYVRWRTPNVDKKAGNIRDWVARYGGSYPCFVILDADSVMSTDALCRLVAIMAAHPRVGLVQTVPALVGGTTLFARLQQFAAHYYGRLLATGLAAWHGPDGNYWGHNAIIRTAAFAAAAGLPPLPGRPPLGGSIMSHDFVEAALLRRSGWEVHLAPEIDGSAEGCPPTLADLIVRDRRWAQGNLQHVRLLGVPNLALPSRIHMATGAFAYLASGLWALTLVIGVVLAFQAKVAVPAYFGSEVSLFPKWPVFDAEKALWLFVATVIAIHLPKILGVAWALRSRVERARHGGAPRAIGGLVVESVLSMLIAPVLMVTQTSAVLSILLGRDAGWRAQRRVGAEASFGDYVRQHRWHLVFGATATAICYSISTAVLAWMSPILIGWLLAPLIAKLTAHRAGRVLGWLLATPQDSHPRHPGA